MLEALSDQKTQVALAAFLATILIQVAGKYGFVLDQATANQLTLGAVGLGIALSLAHAHVEHAETHADANVEVAKIHAPPSSNASGAR